MNSLNFEKEDIDILLEVHESKVKKFEEQIAELTAAKKKLEDKIVNLQKMKSGAANSMSTDEYDPTWTWNSKIIYIFQNNRGPLTASEIVQIVLGFEPNRERKQVMSSVSATLTAATDKKYRKIERYGKDMQYELI